MRGASASYQARRVLKELDLTIEHGETVGLIGLNGAGKSTLVKVLAGQHPLDGGTMTIAGERYAPASLEEAQACGVGVISQNSEPPLDLTVARALVRNTFRCAEEHDAVREWAADLIAAAGVDLDPDAVVGTLDRARRALVEVVRMMAEEAQLVIIDEVAVTLADYEIAALHHVLRRLATEGRGILYITHRMDEVQSIVDRVVVMDQGTVVVDGSVAGLGSDALEGLLLKDISQLETRRSEGAHDVEHAAIALTGVRLGERLRGVDLAVAPGEVLGITGTFDSGVRELVEVLVGQQLPDDGVVYRNGHPVHLDSPEEAERHGISHLTDAVSTRENDHTLVAGLGGEDLALSDEIVRARRMIELVRELRINTANINDSVGHLSGGDQQKAELIRSIERGGDVLVLAHPTQGVDVAARLSVFSYVHQLAATGAAVIFLSTDMSELLKWSHRIVVLAQGTITLHGETASFNEDQLVTAMLGEQELRASGRRARIG
ncbi:ATP-binding cassette domain-containing protein [Serinibacter salmoneus]|uniref:ATP-binding cassette domain-containing protein n=1 Tax=Serinibacter salmoneus TaxID=556530 RepID=UPI0014747E8B|nr:ATP-binding cassette domain-containing protein [Serinibacter salmoneus]